MKDRTEYFKKYKEDNKEKVLEASRKWYKENPDKVKEISRLYRLNNKEKVRAAKEKWRKNNMEKYNAWGRKWRKANPAKVIQYAREHKKEILFSTRKRQAKKLNATPTWANQEIIKDIYKNCPEGYEVDHIIPLQGKTVSGLHVENNLQYLTKSKNRIKHNKFDDWAGVI